MKALDKIKRGWNNLARNLVAEKDKPQESDKQLTHGENNPIKEPEIKVVTFEALIANNLDALNTKMDSIYSKMLEGFKQVGVKFE